MKHLYHVTLQWCTDGEMYSATVEANDNTEAIRLTAEQMSDTVTYLFTSEAERQEWIDYQIGFEPIEVIRVSDHFKDDLIRLFFGVLFPNGESQREINLEEFAKVLKENRSRFLGNFEHIPTDTSK